MGRDGTRAQVIRLRYGAPKRPHIMAALLELVGKDLVCGCSPLPCHGDVLLEMVRRYICDKA
ncbi:DUF4326 domain-containing protein [Ciceribacter sp. RN22]|nr:DUF4326 domain-containing protein [Ciceribacter sp. RN22]